MHLDPIHRHRAGDGILREDGEPYPLGLTFDNGAGTVYALDWEPPSGGKLIMPNRDRALAKALLEIALANVEASESA